ncbi:universal stress protein [Rhodococcus oxybenzonivorans]|uniref:universal stress protein n=1 Tax=Rhodococcus oxybenzonivorans TaxID=1990687 RepID=UPI001E60D8DB|nr:universal stress protein [Rhodococcus oxybenzonivorans]
MGHGVAMHMVIWRSVRGEPSMNQFPGQMPGAFRALFAMSGSDMPTTAGYIKIEILSFMGTLLLLIYAVGTGAGAVLAESVPRWAERYPGVIVRKIAESCGARKVLLRSCEDAHLLIGGSHGHAALGRAVLGSTTHGMLHRGRCPSMNRRIHRETGKVPDRATKFGDRGHR